MAEIKNIIIIILVVSGISFGYFGFANDLMDNYGITQDANLSNTEQVLSDTFNETDTITSRIQESVRGSGGITVKEGFTILSATALAAIKLPFQLIKTLMTLFADLILNIPGFPPWVGTLAIAVIVILLSFAVLSAVLRTPKV